ncbi:MAG: phosphoglycerate kinase [Candidatus Eisenbacteria bacterium]
MAPARYFENRMTLRDVDVGGKRVLVRVDFNVPLDDGKVADDFRIRSALPTIEYILDKGGAAVLLSHLGRPKGKRVAGLSMKPVRTALEQLLGKTVHLAPDCVGLEVERMASSLDAGDVLLLENLRFHPEEEANDPGFAGRLAALADIYVNDAFGTAHRAHASTVGVTHYLKPAVAGFLMEKELEFLGRLLANPQEPFIAILGGAKISGKIEVLKNLMDRVGSLLIGGGIANTFLKAAGHDIGGSLFEAASLDVASEIAGLAASKRVPFLLPDDFVAADRVEAGASTTVIDGNEAVPEGLSIVDIGEKTRRRFAEEIGRARTIFWNGPVGVFEIEDFSEGTFSVARAVADATGKGAVSVIGGGDTASAVARAGVSDKVTHISTGGGASLEFVEGRELPGIAALSVRGR